jgi:outer membrane protein assembly factor BamB
VIDKQLTMKEQETKAKPTSVFAAVGFIMLLVITGLAYAEDWPTYLHDNGRSGTTTEQLQLPLVRDWVRTTHQRPRPAWTETPALQNFWGGTFGHKSRMPRDNAFRVVVVADFLFFGSSNSNKLVCLNTRDGSELWHFFANGPIRFAPTVYDDKVYFGSDDGYVYCLNAVDGSSVWKKKATASSELMFVNGRMVSVCPVRTAVLVDDGVAYWGAGLFAGAQTGLNRWCTNGSKSICLCL